MQQRILDRNKCRIEILRVVRCLDIRLVVSRCHNFYRALVANGKESRGNPGSQPAARTVIRLVEKSTDGGRAASEASFVSTDLKRRTRRYSTSMGVAVQAPREGSVPRRCKSTQRSQVRIYCPHCLSASAIVTLCNIVILNCLLLYPR
ncbi:hypothetical protein PUN28_009981 [Cardiocondyla obscurior]|uniref:Uncharacterized protein n=1 Tax=Cardiocondyla obscurior TaxID=286306 RepID=A0AAW2FRH7_9HYME